MCAVCVYIGCADVLRAVLCVLPACALCAEGASSVLCLYGAAVCAL